MNLYDVLVQYVLPCFCDYNTVNLAYFETVFCSTVSIVLTFFFVVVPSLLIYRLIKGRRKKL